MSVTRASGGTASRPSGSVGMAVSPGAGACAPASRGTGDGAWFGVVPLAGACPGSAGGKSPFGSSGAGACAKAPAASVLAAAIIHAAHQRARPRIRGAYFLVPKSTVGGLLIAASFSTENCGRCL